MSRHILAPIWSGSKWVFRAHRNPRFLFDRKSDWRGWAALCNVIGQEQLPGSQSFYFLVLTFSKFLLMNSQQSTSSFARLKRRAVFKTVTTFSVSRRPETMRAQRRFKPLSRYTSAKQSTLKTFSSVTWHDKKKKKKLNFYCSLSQLTLIWGEKKHQFV